MTRYCPAPATCSFSAEEPFRCSACGRLCCWCFGASDDRPDVCDGCVALACDVVRDTERAPAMPEAGE